MIENNHSEQITQSPEKTIEDKLWQLAIEHPECRDTVHELISILRKKALSAVAAPTSTLRLLREKRGINLRDAAKKCSTNKSMLSRIERGTAQPTEITRQKLATLYGVKIDDLFKSTKE